MSDNRSALPEEMSGIRTSNDLLATLVVDSQKIGRQARGALIVSCLQALALLEKRQHTMSSSRSSLCGHHLSNTGPDPS